MLIQWRASSQWEVFSSSPSSARDGFVPAFGSICPDSKESQAMSPPDNISGCAAICRKLLIFLRRGQHHRPKHMKQIQSKHGRPDIDAAVRGGDWTQPMNGESAPGLATLGQALYWRQIYSEVLGMEEKVLKRIRQLMAKQSDEARREVELTNVPVVAAQAERFRQRLGYWETRVHELNGAAPPQRRRRVPAPPRAAPRSGRSPQTFVTESISRRSS
jgi:hypothetical protein